MSSQATASPTPVRPSPSPQYSFEQQSPRELPQRSMSVAHKSHSSTPSTPHRSNSHSLSYTGRPPSSSRQARDLANVARKDVEQTNLARSSSSRRSSTERSEKTPTGPQAETPRGTPRQSSHQHRSTSRSEPPRQTADPTPTPSAAGSRAESKEPGGRVASGSNTAVRRRTTIIMKTGEWTLGKTIGAGSMGKVKLAKNLATGESVSLLPAALDPLN